MDFGDLRPLIRKIGNNLPTRSKAAVLGLNLCRYRVGSDRGLNHGPIRAFRRFSQNPIPGAWRRWSVRSDRAHIGYLWTTLTRLARVMKGCTGLGESIHLFGLLAVDSPAVPFAMLKANIYETGAFKKVPRLSAEIILGVSRIELIDDRNT